MDNLTEYQWWGNSNQPPENLKTKKQLSELGLSPVAPVGFIDTNKYRLFLYDVDNTESCKPKRKLSEKQLKALEIGREKARFNREYNEWYEWIGSNSVVRNESIEWAKKILKNKKKYLILDTETTGLGDAEIVQIAVIDLDKNILLNTLIKPQNQIPDDVIAIHGITNEMVNDAPTFKDIYPKLRDIFCNKTILIYNKDFDYNIIKYCCKINNCLFSLLELKSKCVMRAYARFYGEYSNYWGDYKWQKLSDISGLADHSALGDCLATLEVIELMAQSPIIEPTEDYFRENIYNK